MKTAKNRSWQYDKYPFKNERMIFKKEEPPQGQKPNQVLPSQPDEPAFLQRAIVQVADEIAGHLDIPNDEKVRKIATGIVKLRAQLIDETRKRIKAETESDMDTRTQIGNIRKYKKVMSQQIKTAKRGEGDREKSEEALNRKVFCLLLIDIDHFKNVNDSYGHAKGDTVLRQVAGIIKKILKRAGDEVFRYGGEEFAVILPATTLYEGGIVAEEIRKAIETETAGQEALPAITVSIGCAQYQEKETDTESTLFDAADSALYQAKNADRNAVWLSKIGENGYVNARTIPEIEAAGIKLQVKEGEKEATMA